MRKLLLLCLFAIGCEDGVPQQHPKAPHVESPYQTGRRVKFKGTETEGIIHSFSDAFTYEFNIVYFDKHGVRQVARGVKPNELDLIP